MKDYVVPVITGGFTFILGYLTFRVRNKEIRITESTVLIKSYSELIDNYRKELRIKDDTIQELRERNKRIRQEFALYKVDHLKLLQKARMDETQRNRD